MAENLRDKYVKLAGESPDFNTYKEELYSVNPELKKMEKADSEIFFQSLKEMYDKDKQEYENIQDEEPGIEEIYLPPTIIKGKRKEKDIEEKSPFQLLKESYNINLENLDIITPTQCPSLGMKLSYDKKDGSLIEGNQWVIYTQGVNLYDIRYLTGVDVYKTICNDIVQIYQTFGIEAARATLIREITYAYERASQTVNYHHLSLLVDLMTSSGQLTSVDRHGMSKTDNDVLARASFEKMVDQVINAAIFGEVDHMRGVSSRIMGGLVVRGGTGMCDVILDTKSLEKSEFIEDIQQNYNKTYKDITTNTIISDVINKEDAGDIFMPM
jgi:DNA-directed RNA polymerase beta' subunit